MRLALVILIGVVLLGLVGTVMVRVINRGRQPVEAPPPEATRKYVRALVEIEPGATIANEMFNEVEVPESQWGAVPADAYQDAKLIAGGKAVTAIAADGYFTPRNVQAPPGSVAEKILPGFVALTVQTPPQPSLYDLKFLNPDDRVDVFGVLKGDEGATQTSSVLLASNVRLMAVDAVFDKYKEQERRRQLDAEIEQLRREREQMGAGAGGVPPTPEQVKAKDDAIAAKVAERDKVPENPSVTVEVSPDQAQRIAVWRNTGDIELALHRFEDASMMLTDAGVLATPAQMAALAGSAGADAMPVVTMDDVVPLAMRSTKQYADQLASEQDILAMPEERQVASLESQVEAERLRVELRNLRRYGTPTPPVDLTPLPGLGPVIPAVPNSDLSELKSLLGDVRRDLDELKGGTTPQPYRHRVEVIRGTNVDVVES